MIYPSHYLMTTRSTVSRSRTNNDRRMPDREAFSNIPSGATPLTFVRISEYQDSETHSVILKCGVNHAS